MFTSNLSPAILNIGPFEIRWYGLMYVIGFIFAYYIFNYFAKKKLIKITKSQVEDLLVYTGIAGILGSRLFYILVYNFSYYISNPLEVFAVWHGGLSIHGCLIGSLVGIYIFSNKYKFNYLQLLDLAVIPAALGIAIGRLGNFTNGELFGPITNVSWCVKFLTAEGCRHPWPLYESLYALIIFFILWKLKDMRLNKGMIFASFITMYSFFRFFSEFFRIPDVQIGYILGLTTGQWLNIVMFITGLLFLYKIRRVK